MKTRMQLVSVWLLCLGGGLPGESVWADLIYLNSSQAIRGTGTQLEQMEASTQVPGFYSEEVLNSGYVRDDDQTIVGNVSAFASLMSSISTAQIRGLGRSTGFGTGAFEGLGSTEMSVTFRVEESFSFEMLGQLRLTPHSLGINGSSATVSLLGPAGTVFDVRLDEEHPPDDLGNVNFVGAERIRGVLPRGEYVLQAQGIGHGSGGMTRCIDFDFTFRESLTNPVPEPEGRCLVLPALFLWGASRRRR